MQTWEIDVETLDEVPAFIAWPIDLQIRDSRAQLIPLLNSATRPGCRTRDEGAFEVDQIFRLFLELPKSEQCELYLKIKEILEEERRWFAN